MVQRERALTLGQTPEDFLTAQVTSWAFDLNNRLVGHTDDGPNTSAWSHCKSDTSRSLGAAPPDRR